jgi:hypothetical protein
MTAMAPNAPIAERLDAYRRLFDPTDASEVGG